MPTTITDDPSKFADVVAPSDGDAGNGASIQTLAQQLADRTAHLHAGELLNWSKAPGDGSAGEFQNSSAADRDMRGGDYDPISKRWILVGNTDGCNHSFDDGLSFTDLDAGMATAVGLQDVAVGATSSAVAVGNSATMYQRATILSGSWGTVTAPGSPTNLNSIVYDTANTRYITVGSGPYAATSDDSTGTAFTDRSGALPGGFAGQNLESLAVDTTGVVVASVSGTHTKIARSGDGGLTWADSTTTLATGAYDLAFSVDLGLFFAIRRNDFTTNNVYTSPDGLVWTQVFSSAIGFSANPSSFGHTVGCYGRAVAMVGVFAGGVGAALSFDGGATWVSQLVKNLSEEAIISSRTNAKLLTIGATGSASLRRAQG